MTITSEVVESKLEDEFFVDEDEPEEGIQTSEKESGDASLQKNEGKKVAKGYVVPKGVAVEELKNYSGHKDLKNKCPDDVHKMLSEKGLFDTYDKFVQSVFDTKTTRGALGVGKWKDQQFIAVLDQFRDDFAAKGVKVALCKRKSGKGTYRWLEFIDVEEAGGEYVPQFDVANFSGQIIKTVYTKIEFPHGVAVEELKQWGGRKKLKEKVPIFVERMLEKYDLFQEYEQMVDHVVEAGVGSNTKMWNITKLKELMKVYQPIFKAKGVEIFVSHKQEWVQYGQHGGHFEHFRWIEFVDRAEQPSYRPQRDAETKDSRGLEEGCSVM